MLCAPTYFVGPTAVRSRHGDKSSTPIDARPFAFCHATESQAERVVRFQRALCCLVVEINALSAVTSLGAVHLAARFSGVCPEESDCFVLTVRQLNGPADAPVVVCYLWLTSCLLLDKSFAV